ncbi:hypothetical protein C8R47DRAFT_1228721 [Mycena vitilis]|nr:hypothetical protein C8R47DRAFT_1228721 [Mycena vitilis]
MAHDGIPAEHGHGQVMRETSHNALLTVKDETNDVKSSEWRPCVTLRGNTYYAATTVEKDFFRRREVVVDDVTLRDAAYSDVKASDVVCEEVYYLSRTKWLYVFHSSQKAVYSSQQFVDTKSQRKLYWQYVAEHPVHIERFTAEWLPEAHTMALVFLKWCSFEALNSSTAKIPFPLKNSQGLANILGSLAEKTESNARPHNTDTDIIPTNVAGADALQEEAQAGVRSGPESPELPSDATGVGPPPESDVQGEDNSHEQIPPPPEEKDSNDEKPMKMESADEAALSVEADLERYQLRLTLIANVLAEKCKLLLLDRNLYAQSSLPKDSQQSALDFSKETDQRLKSSKFLDVLFGILDFASLGAFLRYLSRLEEVRRPILTDNQWRDHILRLVKEWEGFNLISTVLLSASAGILALENLGSAARTAILISILSSFGSITTGLYCISMYQLRAPDSRDSAGRTNSLTVFRYNQFTLMHKGIALILGLPMAFLVWSLVSFMVGILSFNFLGTKTSGTFANVAYGIVSVAAVVFSLILLALYGLSRLWTSQHHRGLSTAIRRRYMAIRQHWRPLPDTNVAP